MYGKPECLGKLRISSENGPAMSKATVIQVDPGAAAGVAPRRRGPQRWGVSVSLFEREVQRGKFPKPRLLSNRSLAGSIPSCSPARIRCR